MLFFVSHDQNHTAQHTSNDHDLNCWAEDCTNKAIHHSLKKIFINIDLIIKLDLDHAFLLKSIFSEIFHEENLIQFFLKNPIIIEQIQNAAHIVINGNELLGSTTHNTLAILTIAYIAKKKFNKKVFIINLSFCTTLHKQVTIQNSMYLQLFSILDEIGTSDNLASNFLDQLKITHHKCFSLLPLYLKDNFPLSTIAKKNSIVIASITQLPNEALAELEQYLNLICNTGFAIKILIDAKTVDLSNTGKSHHYLDAFLQGLKDNTEIIDTNDANTWINTIATAKLLISPNCNDIITASFVETPCIAIASNLEMDCLIQSLKIAPVLSITSPNQFADSLLQQTVSILENPSQFLPSQDQLDKLLLAANNNFLPIAQFTPELESNTSHKTITCAVVTPIGPGHEVLAKEAQDSIIQAINHSKGPFADIYFFPVDDTLANLGRSAARNLAVTEILAAGIDWVFFLDADDLILPTVFESVSQYIDQYDAIWGVIAVKDKNCSEIRLRQPQYQISNLKELISLPAVSTLQIGHFVKTSIAAQYPFDEQRNTGEDFDYYLRVWESEKCFKLSDQAFFVNRRGFHSFGKRSAAGCEWDKAIKSLQARYKQKLNLTEAETIHICANTTQLL